MTKALTRIQEFLKLEASAGLVLMAMALLAMLFANTALCSDLFWNIGHQCSDRDRQF